MPTRRQLDHWGDKIKKRDNYTCQRCGKENLTGKNCHAHHKKPKDLYPELALDLDNGETLCIDCHTVKHWEDDEYRNRLVEVHTGHVHSEEQKRKIGEAQIGMKRSLEARKKMSESAKKKSPEFYAQHIERLKIFNTGKHPSEETRRKMSEAHKLVWQRRKENCR